MWQEMMEVSELSNRLGEFKKLRASGLSPRAAALGARDISTDFAMHGSSEGMRMFNAMIPFFKG